MPASTPAKPRSDVSKSVGPYLNFAQLEQELKSIVSKNKKYLELQVIGKSHEDRPIYLVIATNQDTGTHDTKPAIWIDANIHSTELAGSVAALQTIQDLIQNKEILDTATYYIVPRLNPDGAERALNESPQFLRSGTRQYPFDYKEEGLHVRDIDGDGKILQMRIPDPNGDWKISSKNPVLMEKRAPNDHQGSFYRLMPEGEIHDYDGHIIKRAKPESAIDFNRNFPFQWRPENEQLGAGPYPTSENEVRAMVDFIGKNKNICFGISFHTFSGAILRPYNDRSDESFEYNDLRVYQKLGEIGSQITDYPCVSVYHDFRYHPKEVIGGVSDDWMFHDFGIFAYTIEIWDIIKQAGIENRKFIDWFRDHPHDHDVKIYEWAKKNAGDDAYVKWYKHNHPQLGEVELGGWSSLFTFRNPPPSLMVAEAKKNSKYMLELAGLLPKLAVHKIKVDSLGEGKHKITLIVDNEGFLPTYTSEQAKKRKVAPVTAVMKLPENTKMISGKERTEIGHLEGRSNKLDISGFSVPFTPTDHRGKVEWVIEAKAGTTILIDLISDRAGSMTVKLTLK